MNKSFIFWVEEYLYNPNYFQKIISFFLLPLSCLYCFLMWLRFKSKTPEDFGVKIVSIGNLTVGGSGKTPLVTALAKECKDVAIILRGYGRASKGMYIVKNKDTILCDVQVSGDEAMIYAEKLSHAIVIVSEDRKIAIKKAKILGAKIIFLDDAYSKHSIKKIDILIDVQTQNSRCLPSGAFRERIWKGKNVTLVKEGVDFKRKVEVQNATAKMSLVTAIARAERLDPFLPKLVNKNYFPDHYSFTKEELLKILEDDEADSLLVTYKDYVKVKDFGIPLSLLDLELELGSFYKEIIQI